MHQGLRDLRCERHINAVQLLREFKPIEQNERTRPTRRRWDADPVGRKNTTRATAVATCTPTEERQVRGPVDGEVEVPGLPPADQGGDEDAVAEAADREQFGDALPQPTTMASG